VRGLAGVMYARDTPRGDPAEDAEERWERWFHANHGRHWEQGEPAERLAMLIRTLGAEEVNEAFDTFLQQLWESKIRERYENRI
jgi:hypothetical protein